MLVETKTGSITGAVTVSGIEIVSASSIKGRTVFCFLL